MAAEASWRFDEGDEIAPERHALRLLGGGIRYEAYLAFDDLLYSLVVVKVLRPDRADDSSALRGLAGEAEMARRLSHPVLMRCFDAVLDGPRPHVVLEFLEGPRLSTLIRKYGPLPMEQLLPLAIQLCSALYYMARRKTIHLDVKPRNIIMGAPPRLIDLSIAKTFDDAVRLDHSIGTDAYMSPEQCDPRQFGPVGSPADMWGLGATLFEAMAGYRPFPEGDGPEAAARWPQLEVAPYHLPENIPDALAKPVMACLDRDPAARPTADELAEMLEPFVAALPRRPVLNRLRPRPSWR
jgi:eukaryotic-like serine/threonine-protein kinase